MWPFNLKLQTAIPHIFHQPGNLGNKIRTKSSIRACMQPDAMYRHSHLSYICVCTKKHHFIILIMQDIFLSVQILFKPLSIWHIYKWLWGQTNYSIDIKIMVELICLHFTIHGVIWHSHIVTIRHLIFPRIRVCTYQCISMVVYSPNYKLQYHIISHLDHLRSVR